MASGVAPRAIGLSALVGCAGPAAEPADEPAAWAWEGSAPEEQASAEELSDAVAELLVAVRTVNAEPVLDSYQEAMSYRLDWCPELTETSSEATGEMTYWDGMCEGAEQVWFKGPMTTWNWEAIDLASGSVDLVSEIMASSTAFDGYRFHGSGIRGQTDIFNPDSSIDFNCSCTAMQGMGAAEDGRNGFFSFMDGPAHWTGAAAEGTWLEAGVRPGLWIWAEADPTVGLRHITAAGNVTGFSERLDTARIDLTVFAPLDGSKACTAGEISSFSLSLRDAETASWYELDFEIDDSDPTLCTACAPLESGEEVCVDLMPVLDWEDSPW